MLCPGALQLVCVKAQRTQDGRRDLLVLDLLVDDAAFEMRVGKPRPGKSAGCVPKRR